MQRDTDQQAERPTDPHHVPAPSVRGLPDEDVRPDGTGHGDVEGKEKDDGEVDTSGIGYTTPLGEKKPSA